MKFCWLCGYGVMIGFQEVFYLRFCSFELVYSGIPGIFLTFWCLGWVLAARISWFFFLEIGEDNFAFFRLLFNN